MATIDEDRVSTPTIAVGRVRARLLWARDLHWTHRVVSPATGTSRRVRVPLAVELVEPAPSDPPGCGRALVVVIGPLAFEAMAAPRKTGDGV